MKNLEDALDVVYVQEGVSTPLVLPIYKSSPNSNGDPVLEDVSVTGNWNVVFKVRRRPTSTSEVLYSTAGTIDDSIASVNIVLPPGFPNYGWCEANCVNATGVVVLNLFAGLLVAAPLVARPEVVVG